MSILEQVFGSRSERTVRSLAPLVAQINALEPALEKLSLEALIRTAQVLRTRAKEGESLEVLLPESFALVREAARRTLGERHYDVQLEFSMVICEIDRDLQNELQSHNYAENKI